MSFKILVFVDQLSLLVASFNNLSKGVVLVTLSFLFYYFIYLKKIFF